MVYIVTLEHYICSVLATYLPPANEVWGKLMFLHLCVILFTGGSVQPAWMQTPSQGWTDHPPPRMRIRPELGRPPPRMQTPPPGWEDPPRCNPPRGVGQTPPTDTVNKRAVRILLECILLLPRFTCVAHKLMR